MPHGVAMGFVLKMQISHVINPRLAHVDHVPLSRTDIPGGLNNKVEFV